MIRGVGFNGPKINEERLIQIHIVTMDENGPDLETDICFQYLVPFLVWVQF